MEKKPRASGELAPGEHKITFVASARDQRIIAAGQKKHNLRKVSDVVRMALQRMAEHDNLELVG